MIPSSCPPDYVSPSVYNFFKLKNIYRYIYF